MPLEKNYYYQNRTCFSSEDTSEKDYERDHLHRTAMTWRLSRICFQTSQVVLLYSLRAPVHTSEPLDEKKLRCTGVVMVSTKTSDEAFVLYEHR